MGEARAAGAAGEKGGRNHYPPERAGESGRGGPFCRYGSSAAAGRSVGDEPQLLRPVPHQKEHTQGQKDSHAPFQPEGGGQTQVLNSFLQQRGRQHGGQTASSGSQSQGQATPVPEPVGEGQREWDHPTEAVGQPGQGGAGAQGGKGGGRAEQGVGDHKKAQSQGHGLSDAQPPAQGVRAEHGQQGEQAAHRGDPGTLPVGEVKALQKVGLVDGKTVDSQAHDGEQGQAAPQAYQPGPPGGCTPGPRRDRI